MRLAVVLVRSGGVELRGDGVAGAVEEVLVAELVGVDSRGHGILVEDDVVRVGGVVHPRDGLALLDRHGGRDERETSSVSSELDGGGVGAERHREGERRGGRRLLDVERRARHRLARRGLGHRLAGRHTRAGLRGEHLCIYLLFVSLFVGVKKGKGKERKGGGE